MNLILWRHAQAQLLDAETGDDLSRELTPRGVKQAQRMAKWLDIHLPADTKILCSPARRCIATLQPLERKHKVCKELAPDQSAQALLDLAEWPNARSSILIVGHQPTLGQTICHLLGWPDQDIHVRKGAVWWLRRRQRLDQSMTLVHCVQTPDLVG